MASYARSIEKWERAGLELVAIVVDDTGRNAAMVEKLLLPFPILSDPEARVIREWGVYVDEGVPAQLDTIPEPGIAKPAVFVVNPNWTIAFSFVARDRIVWADRPRDDAILGAVGKLQHGQG